MHSARGTAGAHMRYAALWLGSPSSSTIEPLDLFLSSLEMTASSLPACGERITYQLSLGKIILIHLISFHKDFFSILKICLIIWTLDMLPNANEICRGFRNGGLDRLVGRMTPRLRQLWSCVISEESGFEAPQAKAVSFQWPLPWSSP